MANGTLSRKRLALFQALARQQGLGEAKAFPVDLERRSGPAPLSFAQEGLWLLHQLYPGDPAYNEHFAVRFTGRVDERALEQGVNQVVARHEVLRSTFAVIDGMLQASASDVFVPLVIGDLRQAPEAERLATAMDMAAVEARLPFNLATGPLLRIKLIRIGDCESLLVLTIHHIAIDGWSFGILLREVAAAYEAYSTGVPLSLPDLPVQYSDFARWQREHHDEVRGAADLAYWTGQLSDASPTALVLRTSTAGPGSSAARHTQVIEPALAAQIEKVAQRFGATVFMVWVTAITALWSRYTGQDDIVTGTPVSVRPYRILEELIGVFVNTLALRVRLDASTTFRQLLTSVQATCAEAFARQNVPFERVVQAVNPGHDRGGSPLFQMMFVLQGAPPLSFAGLDVALIDVHNGGAKFDLSVSVRESGHVSELSFEYRRAVFDDAAIKGMGRHLLSLLSSALQDAERRISDMPLLSQGERQQLLEEWNRTDLAFPRAQCVHHLFDRQVERSPDAMAVVCEGSQLSFAELNRRANRLARFLRSKGVGPDVRVGICVERGLEMIVGLLGILKAGGAYVPLDPQYPSERLTYMLENAQVEVVVAVRETAAKLVTGRAHVLLDADAARIAQEPEDGLESGASAENLVYIIYTSGSTGRPKGVAIAHRSVCNLWSALDRLVYRNRENLKIGINAPLVFDASVKQWITLLGGHTLCIIPQEVRDNPDKFVCYCGDHEIDSLDVTPSQLSLLTARGIFASAKLRFLLIGGEAISTAQWAELKADTRVQSFNVYGPTEATVDATVGDIQSSPIPIIGQPIANTQVYVLDAGGVPVPVGVAGELYIGGAGLARGYLNQPELTAEKFIPNAFSGTAGARLYRSGDRVRWLAEGQLEFLGRLDHQVKVRGYRIELGEIETALLEHGSIDQAVVVVRGEGVEQRLVAYVVGRDPAAVVSSVELREHLRGRLPEYMIPWVMVRLEGLPLTTNGKVDRKRLPEPDVEDGRGVEQRSVRNAEEEILCGIFAAVLKREQVGVEEDFFEAGGHSLLATQVISRMRHVFGVELPLRALFEAPTVGGLAERVRGVQGRSLEPVLPLRAIAREGDVGLSYAQQRMWFLQQMEPESSAYNIAFGVRLQGQLEKEVLRKSLKEMGRRHEGLRTSFVVKSGGPVAEIAAQLELSLEEVDLRSLAETEREAQARWLAREEAGQAFDLGQGPLLRTKLLQLEEQEHVLVVTMHHIVSDGWSSGIMMREFSRLYEAYVEGEESPLAELKVQYADYAVWQRERLQGEVLEQQLRYWREQLGGLEPLELPADHARPAVMSQRGGMKVFFVEEEASRKLKEFSRGEGATLFMSLLAAFQVVMGKYAGQQDVAVGTPVANRNRVEVEELIGFFVNTLVLRTDLSGDPSFREVVRRVRRVALDAYQHQDVPFEKLVEDLQPERDLSRAPLFQVMLVLQNTEQQELQMPGLRLSSFPIETRVAKFDLLLTLTESEGGLAGELSYARDLYEAETVERLGAHLRVVLERMVAEPERSISELCLLTEAERQQTLVEWNQTEVEYPQRCVHELFEEQAGRTPDWVAVEYEGRQLSYAELNRRANRLGHYLREQGVGPDVLVGVCLERSLEMVIGLLGILKAGGAYVPLDPAYPQERLQFMVEDAQAGVVLTVADVAERIGVGGSRRTVLMDRDWQVIAKYSGESPQVQVRWEHLAHVTYTSGSTGRPKGVQCPHRGVVNLLCDFEGRQALDPGSRCSVWTSLSFDVFVYELFSALMFGGAIELVPEHLRADGWKMCDWLSSRGIRSAYVPPFMVSTLCEWAERHPGKLRLRRLLVGVEPIENKVLVHLTELIPGLKIINGYGPTEASICATLYEVGPESVEGVPAPIGKPVANGQVYVLDGQQHPMPVGIPGELYIGGAGLARGYLERPELTAERFVPNPFDGQAGERLYRTGDRVRWRADGDLEFLGRADHQKKIRGYRIELGEIEAVLLGHGAVAQAVVAVWGLGAEQRLVGYLVSKPEPARVSSSDLSQYLRERLPEYMVPNTLMVLEKMPLLPTGKIDRKALPEPEYQDREGQQQISPRNVEEEILQGIFAEVLKRERVGVEENFFEAGGHSLLATQVMSRLRSALRVEVPLRALFEAPTVRGLREWVDRARGSGQVMPPLVAAGREGDLPLSYAQQRMWFLNELEPESAAYNMPFGVRLSGELNRQALEWSLNEVVRRHEVLRTTFAVRNGSPVQVIRAGLNLRIEAADLRNIDGLEREAEARRLAQVEAATPFDLGRGPLLRTRLLQLGEQEHVLLVTAHHIVFDGWSSTVLVQEFGQLYSAYAHGESSPLPDLEIQYADFAVWERTWLQGVMLEQQLEYWRQQLAGLPVLELPLDRSRPPIKNHHGAVVNFDLSRGLTTLLQKLGYREDATLFMITLAAFAMILGKYAGQQDVPLGAVIANRNSLETERIIGLFVNTLVIRTRLEPDLSFRELLQQVRQTTLDAYQNTDVPFDRIVERLLPDRDLTRTPLFQAVLVFQNLPQVRTEVSGCTVEMLPNWNIAVRSDLDLYLVAKGEMLSGTLVYDPELFEMSTIQGMLQDFLHLLEHIVSQPAAPILELTFSQEHELPELI